MIADDSSKQSEDLIGLYRMMVTIRIFEEVVADLVEAGEIQTPCHFCIGQEAVPTGISAVLTYDDYIWGAHRSHGHYLAQGGNQLGLMSEIFCRAAGCSGGRGGSMHVCDPSVGMMGSVPIVAATIPIAVGAALASKLQGTGKVSVSYFGDGATEEGHFHESLNLAAIGKLPVIFVCENNFYASHMEISERRAKNAIPEFGRAHGIPSYRIDGNDVTLVHAAAKEAVAKARKGEGPTLLEFQTFRWRGHVGPASDMDVGVKRKDDLKEWLKKDPIQRCAKLLMQQGTTANQLDTIHSEIRSQTLDYADQARKLDPPAPNTLEKHVYRVVA